MKPTQKRNALLPVVIGLFGVVILASIIGTAQIARSQQPTPTRTPYLIPQATCVLPQLLTGRWEEVSARMSTPRSEMAAAVIGNLIYIPGGFGGPTAFEAFDTTTETWTTLREMPAGRNHLMTAALNGKVYVFGGGRDNTFEPTASAWEYDPASDTWRTLSDMPEARFAGAGVALGEYLYVVGGVGTTQSLLRYDPGQDRWDSLASLQTPREHLAATALDGKIYALAGRWEGKSNNTVEIYDVTADQWSYSDPMREARSGFGAAVIGEHLFVAGGEVFEGGAKALRTVEVYHPALREWTFLPLMPNGIHGNPVASVSDTLYILGGSDRAGGIENYGRVIKYRIP